MPKKNLKSPITTNDIAKLVNGKIYGEPNKEISGLCSIDEPVANCMSFSKSSHPIADLSEKALNTLSALLVRSDIQLNIDNKVTLIASDDPQLALIKCVHLFYDDPLQPNGINPKADIDPTAQIGKNVRISAFCVVGAYATIGDNVTLHPHVVIYPGAKIGKNSILHSHACVREDCIIGENSVVQNGAIIGAEGFGYIPDKALGLIPVPQVGSVRLADRVDVGANSCIDRATLGETFVDTGTKIDNLVQVGHNVKIGKFSILCGQVGIAGSTTIGNQVVLGGGVGVADHLYVADGSRVAAKAGVAKSLNEKGDYAGHPAVPANEWRRASVAIRRLVHNKKEVKDE